MGSRSKLFLEKSMTGCPEMEYFWAIDLTSDNPSMSWSVKDEDLEDDDDEDFIEHTLFVRLAVLGSGAVPGEPNVVAMESSDENGKPVKAVIMNLTRGQNSMGNLSLTIDGKVGAKFTLIEGTGPVCISGNHLLDFPKGEALDNSQTMSEASEDDEELGEEEEEDEDQEEAEEEENAKAKAKPAKRKAVPPRSSKQKKAKMEVEDEGEDDDDDDEEEEDIDYDEEEDIEEEADSEEEKSKKKKKKESSKTTKVQDKGRSNKGPVAVNGSTNGSAKKAGKKAKK